MADPAADAAARLYALPLEDFVRERDAAARELRRGGDRESADAVKGLAKPTPVAWTVNHLAREEPERVRDLLEAGDVLRAAQEDALGGGDAEALRDAAAAERAAVDALVDAAGDARPAGRKLSAALVDRLRQTLHAAAADDEVREAIAAGRLEREAEGGGAWGFGGTGGTPPARAKPAPPKREAKPKPKPAPRPKRDVEEAKRLAAQERERKAEERRRKRAEERERREAAVRRRALERELGEARRELASAEERLARARDRVARLEEQLD